MRNLGFLDQFPLRPLSHLRGEDLLQMLREVYPQRVRGPLADFHLIDQFHFRSLLTTPISHLSGGENQILKILAALYLKSDLYFLDEPSQNLDPHHLQVLGECLLKGQEKGETFLMIDHNQFFLRQYCWGMVTLAKENCHGSVLIKTGELIEF